MGTKIDPPELPPFVPIGSACGFCWGTGKPFGTDGTPTIVFVSIFGTNFSEDWQSGDGEPVKGDYELIQDPFDGCSYSYNVGGILIQLAFLGGFTTIAARNPEIKQTFFGNSDDPCGLEIQNQVLNEFLGGTVVITIPEVN